MKTNNATSPWGPALEWYISELSNFNRNALNNDLSMKKWIKTLSYCFKELKNVALGLLNNETNFFDNNRTWRLSTSYVCDIMQHDIRCNIFDIANQLSFAYKGLALELWVFVLPLTKSTRAVDVIRTLEEKQEVSHKMMITPTTSYMYYNLAWRLSPLLYRLPLPSQSEAFTCY